jgi:hypothetical protein
MAEVGKTAQRSKDATLQRLKTDIGALPLSQLTREQIIDFGRDRAKAGGGPPRKKLHTDDRPSNELASSRALSHCAVFA